MELLNVFKTLKLSPDNINLKEIDSILKELDNNNESELINSVTARFQFLENLKDAIAYLPLKTTNAILLCFKPHDGLRTHPKTKIRQMHKGIDMAGTWQEEGFELLQKVL